MEVAGDICAKHGHLFPGDLRPAGVVANESDDGQLVSDERVEFDQGIPQGAIAENDPNLLGKNWCAEYRS